MSAAGWIFLGLGAWLAASFAAAVAIGRSIRQAEQPEFVCPDFYVASDWAEVAS